MPRGGHFAALEQPEALANEVREILPAAAALINEAQVARLTFPEFKAMVLV